MKKGSKLISAILSILLTVSVSVTAHPASGIVVDRAGNVYFIYSGVGEFKIDANGKISRIQSVKDGHWMVLDENEFFKGTHPKFFSRFPSTKGNASIIYAGGGSPVALDSKGNFYYCGGPGGDENPGALSLMKETGDGKIVNFAPGLGDTLAKINDGITGMVAGPGGTLYLACWNALLKVSPNGKVTVLMHPVIISDCDQDPADHRVQNYGIPLLRGIDVDEAGNIFVAATSCHCLLKISPDNKVETLLTSPRPWTPTGVAVYKGNVYVLEYTNANGPATEGWAPRVRKIDPKGNITIVEDPQQLASLR